MFLADKDEVTKEKYAKELANAGAEWVKPLDLWYADSLEFFGLLERRVETLYAGAHVRGSRTWFRKAAKTTTTVSISDQLQTEMTL